MTFDTGALTQIGAVGSGERAGRIAAILSATTFQDGLIFGRFAKLDTGSIDKMDGSATPVIAGVVLRDVASPVENDGVVDSDLVTKIEYIRGGFVTVAVKTGETPALFDRVYASNDGDADDGLATATDTDVDVNAEFIHEVKSGVWVIYVTPAPGEVAAHINDATDAHNATAISIVDAGTHTAETEVEGALQELYVDSEANAASIAAHLIDAAAAHAASAISLLDAAAFTANDEVEAVIAEILQLVPVDIADPGDAGAIPVTRSGTVAITTTGVVDTRTIAIPTFSGQRITLSLDVDAGDAVVTVASAANQAGNNTLTMADAGDIIELIAVDLAGALVWRIGANDGVALSTV